MIHIRIEKGMEKEVKELINSGLFKNQSELIRSAIREILNKYKNA
jgi:Arc/MetJ-type ribon-helix-helix transcriptional regulator